MIFLRSGAGLTPGFASPPEEPGLVAIVTEEAAVQAPALQELHVTPLVEEGDRVAKGAAVACLRHVPDIRFVAPIAGRIARLSFLPGRRLSEIVLFREPDLGIERHDPGLADTPDGLRRLMQTAGVWPWLRRRPFGGMPAAEEVPAAIFVMAADTRPFAPEPPVALEGRQAAFERGVTALSRLASGPLFVVWPEGVPQPDLSANGADLRWLACGPRHPQGSAGLCIHRAFPAGLDAPVWDVHAEDVAELGDLLLSGSLPMERLVTVSGGALRAGCRVRTHPGADLRQITQRLVAPGPHVLMTGSPLDGRIGRWLGQRHRQVTALPRRESPPRRHWLVAALTRSQGAGPVIPTAALVQTFGAALPAAPLLRALGAGDDEAAMALGLLSLLEDDVALADYTLGAGGGIVGQLRAMLDRIRLDYAA